MTTIKEEDPKAVASTIYMQVEICGGPWLTLEHSQPSLPGACYPIKEAGKSPLKLDILLACFFGKDGAGGGCELEVTVQLDNTIKAGGECSAWENPAW